MNDSSPHALLRWQGIDAQGQTCNGEQDAESVATLRLQLLRRGYHSLRILPAPRARLRKSPRVRNAEVAALMRQLATLLAAGMALVPALALVARNSRPGLQEVLIAVQGQIEDGNTLADSLAQHPQAFDTLLIALVAAGERSGTLTTLLQRIADDREKAERLRRKLLKALSYPLAVLAIAALVTAGLLRFAIPQFRELFEGFGAELPPFTRVVLSLADLLQTWGCPLLGVALLGALLLRRQLQRSAALRLQLDRRLLQLPLFGALLRQAAVARYARTLATLSAAGVTLVDALAALASASGSPVYGEVITALRSEVMAGQPLHLAMQHSAQFPVVAVQMLQVGEESGSLETMAAHLAALCEDEMDARIDTLLSLLEPLLMTILGIIVGGLVLAMYLPIFRLGQAF